MSNNLWETWFLEDSQTDTFITRDQSRPWYVKVSPEALPLPQDVLVTTVDLDAFRKSTAYALVGEWIILRYGGGGGNQG